jgi:serine protease AprX
MRYWFWGISWLLLMSSALHAQDKYWINFTDKAESEQLLPWECLSPRALAHRARQGIELDTYDLPVAASYVEALRQAGIKLGHRSRWFNAVSAYLTPAQREALQAWSFVRSVEPVGHYRVDLAEAEATTFDCPDTLFADSYLRQLEMLDLDRLHRSGLTGRGVLVAVFDNGFDGVDTLSGFAHLFAEGRILATRDFVDNDDDVYHPCEHCRHGTYVFSILSALMPGQLVGSAPGADYLLLRTEEDASETRQEEDNWVAAAEFADSMGAQVFTTSLGYLSFDGGVGDYGFGDLDGNTTRITRASDLAASRGILVVNSAGNNSWRGINAPADGDSVIAVGAVDACAEYAAFSSQGPSADGRIKPELSAMGKGNYFLHPNGQVRQGNGTSFSCPMVSGLAACLWQAYPDAPNMQLYEAMRATASQVDRPSFRLGFGIPRGSVALDWLAERYAAAPGFAGLNQDDLWVYPNPIRARFFLRLAPAAWPEQMDLELIDLRGRVVWRQKALVPQVEMPFALAFDQAGLYFLRVRDGQSGELIALKKVLLVAN